MVSLDRRHLFITPCFAVLIIVVFLSTVVPGYVLMYPYQMRKNIFFVLFFSMLPCRPFCGQVKNKIDMVDNLLEIELAYNLLSEGDKSDKVSLV